MTNIAIFASGGGSNARKIIEYFKDSPIARVVLVVSNKRATPGCWTLRQNMAFQRKSLTVAGVYESELMCRRFWIEHNVGFVALAGFLWLVPVYLVRAFPGKIVNIHPALLPKYGGKGM